MKLRSSPLLSVLLSLLLLASTLSPVVHAQDASGLDGIQAAYHDLIDLFYRPLDPSELLHAGWSSLSADADRRGAAKPAPLPDLPGDADQAFTIFSSAYSSYVASLPSSFTAAMAAADVENGMADSVHEQHTHYLPPAVMQRFLSTVGGGQQSIGLGVRLGGDPPGLVADVAAGGPAAGAGLQPGDVIVGADGKDLTNTDTPTLAAALTGPQGSTVDLSIDRGNGPMTITVTRGPYYFPPLESRVLPDGVGYLRLADFVISGTTLPNGTELLSDLDRRLDEFDAQGVHGLILDLRNNGGGSLQTTDELLGRFLPDTARSVHELDQRGHETFELAGGRLHARQLPMAVLINGGSASASEVTASALHDAHRAVLVGQKTAGAVASYRSGNDPQLDAAVGALATAPAPPANTAPAPAISPAALDQLLEAALPVSGEMSTNDRFATTNRWQRLDYIHPNELIDQNGGAPDPLALQQALRTRGYEGSVFASYGSTPGDLPTVSVNADLYATPDGAHSAASSNDLPALQVPIDPPATAGEETVAYRGAWLATGATVITWRRGRVVYTVTYADVPGFDRLDTIAAITQQVDARAQQLTVP